MTVKRIIFAGTPQFAVPSLQAVLHSKHELCAVYTQPDSKAGRGRKLQASAVKQYAVQNKIPVYQPLSLKNSEQQQVIESLKPDLMVVVAYGLLLPAAVLKIPRFGCVNIHASLLPRWRGAAPIQRAIMHGDEQTGITLMQMDVGLDTGAMLAKSRCSIASTDTAQSLHDKLSNMGAELLAQHIDHIEDLLGVAQDNTQATYAHKLEKSEAELDFNQSALALANKIRAFNPWPVAQAEIAGLQLRIWSAQALNETTTKPIASIIRSNKNGLDIATGDGILRILMVQKAGGKPISIADLLNAHPELARSG